MSEPFLFSPALQVDFLNDLYDGDWEYAESVFENVITEIPKLMGLAGRELENENTEGLRQALHKTKPLFGYVGLPQTQAMIQQMENNCKVGLMNGAMKEDFANLKKKIKADSEILEEEFRRLTEYNKK
jgi:HPt (histidine-containing phosphotransfer) domain-containing protein